MGFTTRAQISLRQARGLVFSRSDNDWTRNMSNVVSIIDAAK